MNLGRAGWILSFRGKTVIGIALIEIALLAVLVWSSLHYLGDSSVRAIADRARDTATQFAALAKDAVLSEDLATLETFADEVMANEHMAYLRVIGYGNLLVQRGAPEVLARPYEADSETVRPVDGMFDADAPVREGGTDFGRIEIGMSTQAQETLLQEARTYLLSIATVEVLLVALFSILLGTYLTRALDGLRGAARIRPAPSIRCPSVCGGATRRWMRHGVEPRPQPKRRRRHPPRPPEPTRPSPGS